MAKDITSKTTIKELLDENKDAVINAQAKLNGNFSKLRNPVLRNLMAKRGDKFISLLVVIFRALYL